MRRLLPALFALLAACPAWGHPMPNSSIELRVMRGEIDAVLILPIAELAIGREKPLPGDAARAVEQDRGELEGYILAHVRPTAPDGRPWAVKVLEMSPVVERVPDLRVALRLIPPPGAPADRLTFRYDVIFHRLITHTAVVTLVGDWGNGVTGEEPVVLGTMRDSNAELVIDRSGGSWLRGFAAMFRLGARHIAEGTDHLLFLFALILPAPLVAAGRRWGGYAGVMTALNRITKIVTAFTVGHSITLALGALCGAGLPAAPVESAIALSILVSAVHALVPIFRGREILIAGGFGLVHGLAFAATLASLGLDTWTLAASVLGFNLGIEAFQLVVILAAMPWLILLARTRIYGPFRVGGAVLVGVAAAAWFAERALGWANPVAPIVEGLADRAAWLLAGLALLAGVATLAGVDTGRREVPRPVVRDEGLEPVR